MSYFINTSAVFDQKSCSKSGFFNISLYFSIKVLFNFSFLFFNVDKILYISSESTPSYILYTSTQLQKISCSAYLSLLVKFIFLRCILESWGFCLFTIYPHEKQVNSYSYGKKVFRLQ